MLTPEKVHCCSRISLFADNDSHNGSLESQSLRNCFVTLSRLIDINDFVSPVSLDHGTHNVFVLVFVTLSDMFFLINFLSLPVVSLTQLPKKTWL